MNNSCPITKGRRIVIFREIFINFAIEYYDESFKQKII